MFPNWDNNKKKQNKSIAVRSSSNAREWRQKN